MEQESAEVRIPHDERADTEENIVELPGVVAELGELKEGAVIFEEGLAHLFRRHPVSVKPAVERGELPPPTRLLGRSAWTVGAILRHLEDRQEQATKEKERIEKKIARLSP